MMVEYNLSISNDSCVFYGAGYQTYFQYICRAKLKEENVVEIFYINKVDGNEYTKLSAPIAILTRKDKLYFIKSDLIYADGYNSNVKINIKKDE